MLKSVIMIIVLVIQLQTYALSYNVLAQADPIVDSSVINIQEINTTQC